MLARKNTQPSSSRPNRDSLPTPHAKRQATKQHTKRRQPPPRQFARHGAHTKPPQTFHHPNTEPPRNTLNRDSPPPPQFARHGAHTLNHREPTATPAGPQRTPNTDTRRGAYILCRDIRVSELCEDGSPAGAKRIYAPRTTKLYLFRERKNPADSEESAGFSVKCAPWDSNPEPID